MTKEENLDKITKDFSLLPEEKQNYILGVLQALVYAHDMVNEGAKTVPSDLEQNQNNLMECEK